MFPYEFIVTNSGKIWGRLPCGEINEYDSVEEYSQAYRKDENDIVDGLAEQEALRMLDFPEDFVMREAK